MVPPSQPISPAAWVPPSDHLRFHQGLWQAKSASRVAYPEKGNELCFQIEDDSYWFRHRIDCIKAVIRHFPPRGTIYDIGGGNGQVAMTLQSAGAEIVLVEPGGGARNALRRGVRHVIQATLADAHFRQHSLPAAGAFDVIEHIADEADFLHSIQEQLEPGGRFFCTVPANPALWSEEDVYAGHFRRYTCRTLSNALEKAGFTVEFVTPFFLWLTVPIYLFRTLPTQLKLKDRSRVGTPAALQSDHRLPALISGLVDPIQAWELHRVKARRRLPFGTSLLCVARTNPS